MTQSGYRCIAANDDIGDKKARVASPRLAAKRAACFQSVRLFCGSHYLTSAPTSALLASFVSGSTPSSRHNSG
jgi:hypothetical protein